jgi:tetratricopeptide (TPR) repeat protein
MIVSNKLTAALDCVPLDVGAGAPTVGMSPANAEAERTHVKATVIRNLFIDDSPLRLKPCKAFYMELNSTTTQDSLQGRGSQITIPLAIYRSLTSRRFVFFMRTASRKPKLDLSHLSTTGQAEYRCERALELKDRGEYDAAQEIMRPMWKGVGERPNTTGLNPSVVAEVLFCVGVLTGWIGSRNEIKEADDYARDLLTESIRLYESLGDSRKVAEVRSELALCYWRAGALDEARVMINAALQKLTAPGNTRANALIVLAVIEWSATRYKKALKLLTDNAPLFEKITSNTTKGTYHNQRAMILRKLVTPENKADQLRKVINEYEEADSYFKLARNTVNRAHIKNNIGNVLRDLARYREAHEHLEQARRLTVIVKDKVRTAQVDETRAQIFIAQRRYEEAEHAGGNAVRSFAKAGRQCFLTDALITQGIALARLNQTERARFTFQKAIEVAHQAGALNRAGLAALTMLEEIDQLPLETLSAAYEKAGEWLADSQSQDARLRLEAVGRKLALELRGEWKSENPIEVLYNKNLHLPDEVLRYERELISNALTKVNGSVTYAAKLLGVSYQRLAYILETRHKDLLNERSPVRRRASKPH